MSIVSKCLEFSFCLTRHDKSSIHPDFDCSEKYDFRRFLANGAIKLKNVKKFSIN